MVAKKKDLILYKNELAVNTDLQKKFSEAKSRSISIHDFIDDFLMQFVSAETKRSYLSDLKMFFDFVASGGDQIQKPKDIHSYHFQLYRDDMKKRSMASATINRRLVA